MNTHHANTIGVGSIVRTPTAAPAPGQVLAAQDTGQAEWSDPAGGATAGGNTGTLQLSDGDGGLSGASIIVKEETRGLSSTEGQYVELCKIDFSGTVRGAMVRVTVVSHHYFQTSATYLIPTGQAVNTWSEVAPRCGSCYNVLPPHLDCQLQSNNPTLVLRLRQRAGGIGIPFTAIIEIIAHTPEDLVYTSLGGTGTAGAVNPLTTGRLMAGTMNSGKWGAEGYEHALRGYMPDTMTPTGVLALQAANASNSGQQSEVRFDLGRYQANFLQPRSILLLSMKDASTNVWIERQRWRANGEHGVNVSDPQAGQHVAAPNSVTPAVIAQAGGAGHTGPVLDVRTSAGVSVMSVDNDGLLALADQGDTSLDDPTTDAPVDWLTINHGGTEYVVPLYAKS